jgi:hypothetical protein
MRRWVSDPYEIPGGVWNDIQQLLLARGVAIENLRNEIIRAIPDAPQSMKDDRSDDAYRKRPTDILRTALQ